MIDGEDWIPQRPGKFTGELKSGNEVASNVFKRKNNPQRTERVIFGRVDRFNLVNLGTNFAVGSTIIGGAWYAGMDNIVNPAHSNAFENNGAIQSNSSSQVKIESAPKEESQEDKKNTEGELSKEAMERVMAVVPEDMRKAAKDTIPLLIKTLSEYGMNQAEVEAYALATLEHEGLFEVREEIDGRKQAKKYEYSGGENYFGRGMIMITHDYNYEKYGKKLGIDLLNQPELALDPEIAAKIFALWFRDEGTADYARKLDFVHARKTINPGEFGMDEEPFKSTPYNISDRAWQYLDALHGNNPGETRQDIIDEIIKNVDDQFRKLKAQ